MPKKCPPGVFCIENMTLTLLLIVIGVSTFLIYSRMQQVYRVSSSENKTSDLGWNPFQIFFRPNVPYSNVRGDVYMNPYTAPMRDTRYMVPSHDIRGQVHQGPQVNGIPINVPTQSVDTHYRQVGILTRHTGEETILPLMGRPLFANRYKWQFYTMSDKNNSVKLPISNAGRSCTGEYGCDNLFNGDNVYVEGYNDAFKVTMYDNASIQYIPFL